MTQPKTASKFTPGPWQVEEVGVEELFIVKPDGKGGWFGIAELSVDAAFADARLIAKAPAMYELLSHITQHDPLLPCGFCINEAKRIKAEIDGEVTP